MPNYANIFDAQEQGVRDGLAHRSSLVSFSQRATSFRSFSLTGLDYYIGPLNGNFNINSNQRCFYNSFYNSQPGEPYPLMKLTPLKLPSPEEQQITVNLHVISPSSTAAPSLPFNSVAGPVRRKVGRPKKAKTEHTNSQMPLVLLPPTSTSIIPTATLTPPKSLSPADEQWFNGQTEFSRLQQHGDPTLLLRSSESFTKPQDIFGNSLNGGGEWQQSFGDFFHGFLEEELGALQQPLQLQQQQQQLQQLEQQQKLARAQEEQLQQQQEMQRRQRVFQQSTPAPLPQSQILVDPYSAFMAASFVNQLHVCGFLNPYMLMEADKGLTGLKMFTFA